MKNSNIKHIAIPLLIFTLIFSMSFAAFTASAADTLDTSLSLSGPSGDVYEGDTAVFTATLKDSNGDGVKDGKIYLRNGYNNYYGLTDDKGVAKIEVSDLSAISYAFYAEFYTDASNWGGNIYSASKSNTVYLTVKDASAKPSEPSTEPSQSEKKIPTNVSIDVVRELPKSRWFDIKIKATDKNDNPVLEDIGDNIELYVNGEKKQSTKLYSDDGEKTIEYYIPNNGEYNIYVKYIGRGDYAGSESGHVKLNVLDDSYTAEADDPKPAEPEQPSEEPTSGNDPEEKPSEGKISSSVSIRIERDTPTSDYITIKTAVNDASGNPITETSENKDIELYVNGVKTQETKLNDWFNEGTTTLSNIKLSENTAYDIYVAYTGSKTYESSESRHYSVKLAADSFSAEPVKAEEPTTDENKTSEEPSTGESKTSEEPTTGEDKTSEEPATGENKTSEELTTAKDKTSGELTTVNGQSSKEAATNESLSAKQAGNKENQTSKTSKSDLKSNTEKTQVVENKSYESPKTGNEDAPALLVSFVLFSAGIAAVALYMKNKKRSAK